MARNRIKKKTGQAKKRFAYERLKIEKELEERLVNKCACKTN